MKKQLPSAIPHLSVLVCALVSVTAALSQTSPSVLIQPENQMADYGANVMFEVQAAGGRLTFQWKRNGEDLRDYRNVAGSQTAMLKLVGVAHDDAGGYSVVISDTLGAVTSVVATLTVRSQMVFKDDFESGSLSNWTPFAPGGDLTLSHSFNRTPDGSGSALLTRSLEKMYHNLGVELVGRVSATFWIYDSINGEGRAYGELRGYTGSGHARYAQRGGLHQILAIGRYDIDFGRNTGTLAGETTNTMRYQGRVLRGTNAGWFNLDAPGAPERSEGWHKFEIKRSADGSTVDFYVDGVLGKVITGVAPYALDCVAIGSSGTGSTTGTSWFDDVTVEAYPRRFDWQTKDSSGKGLFDWMKLRETGTNVVVAEDVQLTTVFESPGYQITGRLGNWERDREGIHALDTRGHVEYVVTAPADDAYRIEVEGREQNFRSPLMELPLIISIDGEPLGRFMLTYEQRTNGFVHCFTPFIRAGPHTVRIDWDNAVPRCSLRVEAVRLQSLQAGDSNRNGYKDWVENRIYSQSGIDVAPERSAVSPVCVEGRGQYLSMMSVTAEPAPATPIPVKRGAGHRWYANVPLAREAATSIEVTHQNGVLVETRQIIWEETNLLEANDLVIRQGDSLLLTAVPADALAGEVFIGIVGVTNYLTDVITPVVHQFNQGGTFVVRGSFTPTGAVRSITVRVIGVELEPVLAAWVGKGRHWNLTNLPPLVVLDVDPRLKMSVVVPTERGEDIRPMRVINDATEARGVVARLGRAGPIVASTTVQGFHLYSGMETYLRHLGRYDDESDMIEATLILSPVLPEITVDLRVLVSGVTFDDGTMTRTLTAADFDTLGICRIRFIRAAGVTTSVCHTTKVYQDGILIGWPGNPQ